MPSSTNHCVKLIEIVNNTEYCSISHHLNEMIKLVAPFPAEGTESERRRTIKMVDNGPCDEGALIFGSCIRLPVAP
jgi:hypothetical protein